MSKFDLTKDCPESKVNNKKLKVTVKSGPSQSVYKLSLKFGFTKKVFLKSNSTHLNSFLIKKFFVMVNKFDMTIANVHKFA